MVVIQEPGQCASGVDQHGLAVGPSAVRLVEVAERGGQQVVCGDGRVGVPGQRPQHVEWLRERGDSIGTGRLILKWGGVVGPIIF